MRPGPRATRTSAAGTGDERAGRSMAPEVERWYRPDHPLDPWLTVWPLVRGRGDPTARRDALGIWRASRTPEGAATVLLHPSRSGILAQGWGPGARWAIDRVPALLGERDDPAALRPRHAPVSDAARRLAGLRFGRSDAVFEALLPSILEQKVTGSEARRSYRALVRRHGEPAPGPGGLLLAPTPVTVARLPLWAFHPLGIEERRAATIRRAAALATRLEEAADMPRRVALERLRVVPGIGPWTAAEVCRTALGDPDAVSIGDFHMPHLVSWALAREPRGDDARMLELLEPYRGQRARVVRLLEAAGVRPPRYGPRMAPRSIAAM